MSNKRKRRKSIIVKCAYCGRENVVVTSKGYMKPHVKFDGKPCLFVHVVIKHV